MPLKKKLILILAIIVTGIVLVTAYFYFRAPKTLADVVGSQFMEPDQLIILDGSNGNKRELKKEEREEMLELLRTVKILDSESIELTHGASFIQFIKGDDRFNLLIHEGTSFKIHDPDDSARMIVYYMEKEGGRKIREKMKLSF